MEEQAKKQLFAKGIQKLIQAQILINQWASNNPTERTESVMKAEECLNTWFDAVKDNATIFESIKADEIERLEQEIASHKQYETLRKQELAVYQPVKK